MYSISWTVVLFLSSCIKWNFVSKRAIKSKWQHKWCCSYGLVESRCSCLLGNVTCFNFIIFICLRSWCNYYILINRRKTIVKGNLYKECVSCLGIWSIYHASIACLLDIIESNGPYHYVKTHLATCIKERN